MFKLWNYSSNLNQTGAVVVVIVW